MVKSNMIFGYARVSTDGQSVAAQIEALKAAGAQKVFAETASGARTDRRQLARTVAAMGDGDTLIVTRLDRLARSTRDLLNVIAVIAEKGATFRSLSEQWADTTTAHGRLMLTVIAGLAEFERELIRSRTGEGRERAKRRGVKFGRKRVLTEKQQEFVAGERARADGPTIRELAALLKVSAATIGRIRPAFTGGMQALTG